MLCKCVERARDGVSLLETLVCRLILPLLSRLLSEGRTIVLLVSISLSVSTFVKCMGCARETVRVDLGVTFTTESSRPVYRGQSMSVVLAG